MFGTCRALGVIYIYDTKLLIVPTKANDAWENEFHVFLPVIREQCLMQNKVLVSSLMHCFP